MASLQDWKRAVVHLECAGDTKSFDERTAEWLELVDKMRSGKISPKEWYDRNLEIAKEHKAMRFQGTALFLEHESRRYLLTARHVLDETIARCVNRGVDPSSAELAEKRIFSIIFRVLNPDDARDPNSIRPHLMNLNTGLPSWMPYTFSEYPQPDLAIISLDNDGNLYGKAFGEELVTLGYSPISSSEIMDEPSAEGVDVYTVGFPRKVSVLVTLPLPLAVTNWSSSDISVPAYSFGKISMLHPILPFFWVDMSIFPGNSGGPIVENGQLVGIISSQPFINVDSKPDIQVRAPFAKAFKAEFIRGLLAEQIGKDEAAARLKLSRR
jgi:hypothetical protein